MDQNNDIEEWSSFLKENFEDKYIQTSLIKYATCLLQKDVPVIFTFEHLSMLMEINKSTLGRILYRTESFYYEFEIPKRSGGVRQICAPYPILLYAQRWIYENILLKGKVHSVAKGFVPGQSIVDNAKEHVGNQAILKMDIKDFFPSITRQQVYYIFKWFGYTRKIAWNLASICCLNDVLPQGAPTSPILSNIISKRLDRRLVGLASHFNLKYTRYADDLTFSGENIPIKFINYVIDIVSDQGFNINEEKTRLISGNKQKIVTGISISEKITIPRAKKREIRKSIYHILTKGLFYHQEAINNYDPIYLERLLGYLYFWLSVEPENGYVINSIRKLKDYSSIIERNYHS